MIYKNYSKQKRVAIVSFLGTFVLFLLNIVMVFFFTLNSCYTSTIINLFSNFVFCFLFFITFFKENNFFKFIQIFAFLLMSFYSAIINNNPSDVSSIAFLIYAIILFWAYFKDKVNILKIIIFIVSFLVWIVFLRAFISSMVYDLFDLNSCLVVLKVPFAKFIFALVSVFAFFGTYFALLWVVLVDEIKYLFEKSNKLQIALYRSESDAWYGRNVIGVVHNIKNKLTPVYLLLEEFSHDERLDKETREFCKNQIKSVDGLSGLLDKLMYSTKIKHKEDFETINVNKTIKSVAEYFKSNLEFKKNINLTVKQQGFDMFLKCNPMNFCFVIENIIKNSYDNLKKLNKDKKIEIEIFNKNEVKYLSIKDNGTGIQLIKEDEFSGSLLDCHFFKMGNSTKKDGLGYGMEFIKSFVVENKLNSSIYTKKGFGTEIKIFLN